MFFDALESEPPEARESRLFENMPARLQAAVASCPGLARHLDGQPLAAVSDRASLAQLPVLRKAALMAAQAEAPPFGGFAPEGTSGGRVFMSPGPVFEVQLSGADPWQSARALHAAGLRRGDLVHNAFSYHQTPGGFILDEGARALGCTVYPAGVGNTASQVQAILQLRPSAYVGTPDYLQTLLDHARDAGTPISSIVRAQVSGGPLFPAVRAAYESAGIQTLQCYATADLGVIAYETQADGRVLPGMVVNEGLIVEVVQPGSDEPVAPGEIGEVVVTRLHPEWPLVRFATGDLSASIDDPSPCGRTNRRLRGWLGRADQRTKVRGMFVDPAQVQAVRRAHPELIRARLVVARSNGKDVMTLQVQTAGSGKEANPDTKVEASAVDVTAIATTLKSLTNLSGDVQVVAALAADGIVIEDQRDRDGG